MRSYVTRLCATTAREILVEWLQVMIQDPRQESIMADYLKTNLAAEHINACVQALWPLKTAQNRAFVSLSRSPEFSGCFLNMDGQGVWVL